MMLQEQQLHAIFRVEPFLANKILQLESQRSLVDVMCVRHELVPVKDFFHSPFIL